MAPNVTKLVLRVTTVRTVKDPVSVRTEGGVFLLPEPVNVQLDLSAHAATSRVQLAAMDWTVLGWPCAETEPGTIRSQVAVCVSLDAEERTVHSAALQAGLGRTACSAVTAVMEVCVTV